MKKAISLLLALCMALVLCACGSGKQAQSYPTANNGIGFSADKIESISGNMDDMLDIEAVKVTHDSVYYARIKNNYTVKEGDEPNRIMLQFNLIDKQGVAVENSYMIFDGVEPNKSCWGYIGCQTKYTDISAIEFLGYMFQFDTHNINDPSAIYGLKMMGGGSFTEPIVYSVEDMEIEGVTQESPAASESVLCALGDTISTGTLELTVSSAEFCEAVQAGSNISMGAPRDDMILGCFEITVKNAGKELFNVLDYLDAKIDYNDGYTYSTKDSPSYLFDKTDMLDFVTFFFEGDRMGGSGNFVDISPLSSKEYILAIPCDSALAEDETSPLKVIFTLLVDGVDKEFVYVIR